MKRMPETLEEINLLLDEQRIFTLRKCIEAEGEAMKVLLNEEEYKIFLLFVEHYKILRSLERRRDFQKGYNSAKKDIPNSVQNQ